jgi:hypothetical protein
VNTHLVDSVDSRFERQVDPDGFCPTTNAPRRPGTLASPT